MTASATTLHDIHANSLLASTFNNPKEVLANPFLDPLQKRCVLAAWASDAFAVESKPWLRQLPGSADAVPIGDILAALKILDHQDDARNGDGPKDGPKGGAKRARKPQPFIKTRAFGRLAKSAFKSAGRRIEWHP